MSLPCFNISVIEALVYLRVGLGAYYWCCLSIFLTIDIACLVATMKFIQSEIRAYVVTYS